MMIDDEELRNLYEFSSQEQLQRLKIGLLHLQQHPDDVAIFGELRQDAHSLKGDSRAVGVETVEPLIQQIEQILKLLQAQRLQFTSDLGDRLDRGIDAIGQLVQEAVTGRASDVHIPQVFDLLADITAELAPLDPERNLKILHLEALIPPATRAVSPIYIDDEELRQLYEFASQDCHHNLKTGLSLLAQNPIDPATLEKLRRDIHRLKGDARSVGIGDIEILAKHVEAIFKQLQVGEVSFTAEIGDRLHQVLDAINQLVHEAVTNQPSHVDVTQLLEHVLAEVEIAKTLQSEFAQISVSSPDVATNYIYDQELRDIYQASSQDRLQQLESGLLHLETHPDDAATLEQLLRSAHSLKGDSRAAGVESVEAITHCLEEILERYQNHQIGLTSAVSDRLYQGLDAIGHLVRAAVTGQPHGVDIAFILQNLTAIVSLPTLPEFRPNASPDLTPLAQRSTPPATAGTAGTAGTSALLPPKVDHSYQIDTVRVQMRDLDRLMALAEELAIAKTNIAYVAAEMEEMTTLWKEWKGAKHQASSLATSSSQANPEQARLESMIDALTQATQENCSQVDKISEALSDRVRTLRLLPLSTVFQLFPRVVRDLAKQQAKEVQLLIEGGETTADKSLLEELKDSLTHLIRNAIDHGIETPGEREELGKSAIAKICLRAYHTAHKVVIEIEDDGRGLDLEQIKQTAIKRDLYDADALARMSTSQIQNLVLASGFSTRSFITEISGRGIGLDVVRTNVERLKGEIQIESTPGKGCIFRIHLNTTLTTINALFFSVQGVVHALPIEWLDTTVMVSQDQISITEDSAILHWNEQTVPVADLGELLALSNSRTHQPKPFALQAGHLHPCMILKVGAERAGFLVDRLLYTQEVVMKPQSRILKRIKNVAGATILPTGEVCMILNATDLMESLQNHTISPTLLKTKETIHRKPVILLVEDSIPVRTQEKRLLEKAGYEVVIAVDGLDGYNKLETRQFDAVLSDVEMPNLDGLALTAKIRQHQDYKNLPVILVTTLDSDEDKKRGAAAGANAYIIKHRFNQDILLDILGRIVHF
jgi:two-component system, chemotaxis family, sensor kinase CheA